MAAPTLKFTHSCPVFVKKNCLIYKSLSFCYNFRISKSSTLLDDVPGVRKTRLAQKKGVGKTALKLKSPLTIPANPASPIKKPRRGRPPKQTSVSTTMYYIFYFCYRYIYLINVLYCIVLVKVIG